MSEKTVGMELKKTMNELEAAKGEAIRTMGECISLAADAGDILLSARKEELDIEQVMAVAGINGEQGRRLERVAKHRPTLANPEPGQVKQLALWAGILPDPIETSIPKPEKSWHSYLIKARQWVARKTVGQWSARQKEEFVEEARPIVIAYIEAGGEPIEAEKR